MLCGRENPRTSAMAQRLNVPEITNDYAQLCARSDIDAVTIATQNVFHAQQAQAVLTAGKHVFCEKPLGMTVDESAAMLHAAENTRKIHQVAFTYRYLYGVQELKRRLLNGDIGAPHYIRLQFDSWEGLHPDSTVGFREKMSLAGGGMLYDVGTHLFDLTHYILGPIQAVTGFTALIPRERIDKRSGKLTTVETDDMAGAWFVCSNGVRGEWFASRATPCSGEKAYVEVVGRDGALKAALSRGTRDSLKISRPTRQAWETLPLPKQASDGKAHCLPIMMRSFVDACLRGKSDETIDASFYDGVAVQHVIGAVQEASCHQDWNSVKVDAARRECSEMYVGYSPPSLPLLASDSIPTSSEAAIHQVQRPMVLVSDGDVGLKQHSD